MEKNENMKKNEKLKEYHKLYYQKNKDKIKQLYNENKNYKKEYYIKNRSKLLEYQNNYNINRKKYSYTRIKHNKIKKELLLNEIKAKNFKKILTETTNLNE